jgi:hypothetical protein
MTDRHEGNGNRRPRDGRFRHEESRGNWRRGYGGYGLGESGRDPCDDEARDRDARDDRDYEELRHGYGLGGGDIRLSGERAPDRSAGRGPADYRRRKDAIRDSRRDDDGDAR